MDPHEDVRLSFAGPGEIKRREVSWLDPHEDLRLSFEGPGEIKRREVSWVDPHEDVRLSFAGPGEIKGREVVRDRQESPGEREQEQEVEQGSENWICLLLQLFLSSCATAIVLVTLLRIAAETAVAEDTS